MPVKLLQVDFTESNLLFDDDYVIPAFGFGGNRSKAVAERCFPFVEGRGCEEFDEILQRYHEIASTMELSAPASFAPVIREAIEIVKKDRCYHILIIIANGHIDEPAMTRDAIVEASNYPICTCIALDVRVLFVVLTFTSPFLICVAIVMIGVGDGPWDLMKEFDDQLPARRFDNFQFVNYNTIPNGMRNNPDGGFAMQALMEIPGR
ncbi:hypothetical protein BBJ28_00014999 [Nothophytophthora sp. Chile5]|nr:hypothetical protein BBJ28_00014999 [Nothophytophthora sp. Chile5]